VTNRKTRLVVSNGPALRWRRAPGASISAGRDVTEHARRSHDTMIPDDIVHQLRLLEARDPLTAGAVVAYIHEELHRSAGNSHPAGGRLRGRPSLALVRPKQRHASTSGPGLPRR